MSIFANFNSFYYQYLDFQLRQFLKIFILLPDSLLRIFIKGFLFKKSSDLKKGGAFARKHRYDKFLTEMTNAPIVLDSDIANLQHYEVNTDFFQNILGSYMKYSSGYWNLNTNSLSVAEETMLNLYLERAEIQNGHSILDLGGGWGSFSLFIASKFPQNFVQSVTNSESQEEYINYQASKKGLKNLRVIKTNIDTFEPRELFDRIISIEMFEHLYNLPLMLKRINTWLENNGKLFIHMFVHKNHPYRFASDKNWIAQYFFSEGMMPAEDIFSKMDTSFIVEKQWRISGLHYKKTIDIWLKNFYANKSVIIEKLTDHYGKDKQERMFGLWKMFFLICSELFGYKEGKEWFVAHYKLIKRDRL